MIVIEYVSGKELYLVDALFRQFLEIEFVRKEKTTKK